MVNYRIRYTVKNVFQIIFIQRKCHYFLYIYCNFGCKHGKTLLKVCKEELNLFETNKHMLNNSKHVFVVGLIINSYTYYYHTYKEVLLSGKPNVTYMMHFRNFLKRGTEFFYIFFLILIPMLIQFLREIIVCCNISMLGLSWVNRHASIKKPVKIVDYCDFPLQNVN